MARRTENTSHAETHFRVVRRWIMRLTVRRIIAGGGIRGLLPPNKWAFVFNKCHTCCYSDAYGVAGGVSAASRRVSVGGAVLRGDLGRGVPMK